MAIPKVIRVSHSATHRTRRNDVNSVILHTDAMKRLEKQRFNKGCKHSEGCHAVGRVLISRSIQQVYPLIHSLLVTQSRSLACELLNFLDVSRGACIDFFMPSKHILYCD